MKIQSVAYLLSFFLIASIAVQGLQPSQIQKHRNHLTNHHPSITTVRTINEGIRTHDTKTMAESRSKLHSSWFTAACIFASCTFSWWQPCPVLAETTTPADDAWSKNIAASLQAPSEDMPQIPLPVLNGGAPNQATSSATANIFNPRSKSSSMTPPNPSRIQALVSLKNPRIERPFGNDFMVVQVLKERPPREPYAITEQTKQNVLGGAKIQVGKTRFPSSISLGVENAKSRDTWKELTAKQDLWIETTICKEDSLKFPCAPEEQRYRGVALSKFFDSLPTSSDEDAPAGVRLPAALALERVNDEE